MAVANASAVILVLTGHGSKVQVESSDCYSLAAFNFHAVSATPDPLSSQSRVAPMIQWPL